MKNTPIKTRILLCFTIVLAAVALITGVAYVRLGHLSDQADTTRQNAVANIYLSTQIRTAWFEHYLLLQQLLNADEPEETRTLDRNRLVTVRAQLDTLSRQYGLSSIAAEERMALEQFSRSREQLFAAADELAKMSADPPKARHYLISNISPVWHTGADQIRHLAEMNDKAAGISLGMMIEYVSATQIILLITMLMAMIYATLSAGYLSHSLTAPMLQITQALDQIRTGDFSQRLELGRKDEFRNLEMGFNRMTDELAALVGQAQKSSLQVTTAVAQIAATAREHQATANETAATTTEIGATSREIFVTAKDLAYTLDNVSKGAESTAQVAAHGQSGLAHMAHSMKSVMEAASLVNGKLAILNEKASNINMVVTTISKVAGQTNLLSLNAAIEAEKAGEYGRGFSVVATEIRRLADQTAVASSDIERTVKEIQSAISSGVMGMDKFTEEVRRGIQNVQDVSTQLSQVTQQVQDLSPQFRQVHEGMQRQAGSAEQINESLHQLTESAQHTVESLRQSGQAIDELTFTANGLRNGVSRFRVKANGAG